MRTLYALVLALRFLNWKRSYETRRGAYCLSEHILRPKLGMPLTYRNEERHYPSVQDEILLPNVGYRSLVPM